MNISMQQIIIQAKQTVIKGNLSEGISDFEAVEFVMRAFHFTFFYVFMRNTARSRMDKCGATHEKCGN